ncbi:MAG: hypothetical protein J0M12_04790 [Deltaproteobacteria bacterium]|nr:hypothetical protein [Deltaproteobacteria bacterium]
MGLFWDDPDSPENRRKQDAERRRRDEERDREARAERAKIDKKREEERQAIRKAQQAEDDKAIAELQRKFHGDQGHKADQAKAAMGLHRGPGLGSSGTAYRNPNVQLSSGGALPKGFNPNAVREGQDADAPGKGDAAKGPATTSGPKLPRPF